MTLLAQTQAVAVIGTIFIICSASTLQGYLLRKGSQMTCITHHQNNVAPSLE